MQYPGGTSRHRAVRAGRVPGQWGGRPLWHVAAVAAHLAAPIRAGRPRSGRPAAAPVVKPEPAIGGGGDRNLWVAPPVSAVGRTADRLSWASVVARRRAGPFVHPVLTRNGMVRAQGQLHLRKYRRWQREAPMQLWRGHVPRGGGDRPR